MHWWGVSAGEDRQAACARSFQGLCPAFQRKGCSAAVAQTQYGCFRCLYWDAGDVRQRMRGQGVLSGGGKEKQPAPDIPEDVPRALHRFYKKGTQ